MTTNTHELIEALEKMKAYADSTSESWAQAPSAVSEVQRQIGNEVIPLLPSIIQALAIQPQAEAVPGVAEPLFLIIAGGDGNDQKLVRGYEPAARAAFKMVIHGEPEDEDNNDYDVAIYDAVKDPDSEEWNDAGAQGIVFSFEDGFLQVTRIDATLTPAQPAGDVRERVIDLIEYYGGDCSDSEELADKILAALSATPVSEDTGGR